ncbi:MAG: cysteine desulfurase family protein [Alphaproteobacteria bacterium]
MIYLDYNGSTPLAPEVAETVRRFLDGPYGNPSALHWASRPARDAIEEARVDVAALFHCTPGEVVFTSGGTESINHAIKGAFFARKDRGNHIITTCVEHPSTLSTCGFLESLGAEVTYLPVDRDCRVDPDVLRAAITDRTILVSIMHANGEVGTIQPIPEIAAITRQNGVLLHLDAAQTAGKIPLDVDALGVDLLSIAAQKMYGPKGVGALYTRGGVTVEPLIHGADHQSGRRAGTESAMLSSALGTACRLARDLSPMARVKDLRDDLHRRLRERYGGRLHLNGHGEYRLPNTLNVSFEGQIGSEILDRMPQIAATTGSACHEGKVTVSSVLQAMGVSESVGAGTVRFSLGRPTTAAEIDAVVQAVATAVAD